MNERNFGLMENIEATKRSRPQSSLFFGLWCGLVTLVVAYAAVYFVWRIWVS